MKLLISHFYNEEYLLPWWLTHHREMFDHGVLIDYHSTDRSVEICRELVPDWEIVTSEYKTFAGIMCDFEVMKHEERFPGAWKLVLNTTEFLVGDQIDNVIRFLETNDYIAARIPGAVIVDDQPDSRPDPAAPLVAQKHHGFPETEFPHDELNLWWIPRANRTRVIHNYAIGAYTPGRHTSSLPRQAPVFPEHLMIWWYAYSPWTPEFIARKTQIKKKVEPSDPEKLNFGNHHMSEASEMAERRDFLLPYSHDLEPLPTYKRNK